MATRKRMLTDDELAEVLRRVGVPVATEYLDGGMFASAYLVTLRDGVQVVVKAAPVAGSASLLFHEHDLMRTEVAVLTLAGQSPAMKAPRLLDFDLSRTRLDVDVMVVSSALGDRWDLVEDSMTADAHRRAQGEVGGVLAAYHSHGGTAFGVDVARAPDLSARTWVEAFGMLLDGQLAEAARRGVRLPEREIRAVEASARGALERVTHPVLLHGDLWRGNVFVDRATGAVTCAIDCERSLWGDPLFDLAMADPMSVGAPPEPILAGYARGGSAFDLSPSGRTRLDLYRLWLTVTMIVEITAREYRDEGTPAFEARLRDDLGVLLDRLGGEGRPGPWPAG
ncbi:aminoglycoside phosphotransferase family protein [Herbiconiux sp. 11R-BC]|uniref:phosphotransferase n=1 Tax=Herbiconiux sp. 11R-BC TaxID=3111637 RepID=UPI003BFDAB65